MEKNPLRNTGLIAPDILVPDKQYNLEKWSVVACDQYTSEPEYWEGVKEFVGNEPSTLNLIFPEVFLGTHDEERIKEINRTMASYLEQGIFTAYDKSLFLVQRKTPENPDGRWGLIAALDLEEYDYSKDSKSMIRATEGTILDRIPPRKLIRKDAPLELPHILVLIDDKEKTVIEPLIQERDNLEIVYSINLMMDSGSITAYRVNSEEHLGAIGNALRNLADQETFLDRYHSRDVLLYAMGDGNHSLATAKSCWEDIKKTQEITREEMKNHPARYALVEIENIFDPGITFEPIHRVLFNCKRGQFMDYVNQFCSNAVIEKYDTLDALLETVENTKDKQVFGMSDKEGLYLVSVENAESEIAAGTLQLAIDSLLKHNSDTEVDYTHGASVTDELGKKAENIALFLPAIDKEAFFPAIIHDGALPRKTFSMGEAHEKRFYIEARKISPEK